MSCLLYTSKSRLMPTISGEEAQQSLVDAVMGVQPLMVARFGAVEIKAILYKSFPWLSMFLKEYTYRHCLLYTSHLPKGKPF